MIAKFWTPGHRGFTSTGALWGIISANEHREVDLLYQELIIMANALLESGTVKIINFTIIIAHCTNEPKEADVEALSHTHNQA